MKHNVDILMFAYVKQSRAFNQQVKTALRTFPIKRKKAKDADDFRRIVTAFVHHLGPDVAFGLKGDETLEEAVTRFLDEGFNGFEHALKEAVNNGLQNVLKVVAQRYRKSMFERLDKYHSTLVLATEKYGLEFIRDLLSWLEKNISRK